MQARPNVGCKCQRPLSGLVASASRQSCSSQLAVGVKGRLWVWLRVQAWSHSLHPCSSSPTAACRLQVSEAAVGFGGARKCGLIRCKLQGLQPESASSTLRPQSGFVARASVDCILQYASTVRPSSGFVARASLDSFAAGAVALKCK